MDVAFGLYVYEHNSIPAYQRAATWVWCMGMGMGLGMGMGDEKEEREA